jgi:hypothetical protein
MKNTRRDFIAKGLAIGASIPVLNACGSATPDLSGMFVHHVYFWMKNPENKDEFEQLKKGLEKLVTIETIKFKHIGIPAETRREVIDSSYQFSLLTLFESKEGQDIYQDHPVHLQFVDECKHLWDKVVVYDSVSIE